ncbi:MAG: AAA family ATPase [Sphingobacteriales bacterium]|nr:AAA family ATPase [Sphingobacteriales bacterium]
MITIAVYNLKGGVGKTATSVNMAALAASEGDRTLLWDLDPQASTSFYYRVKSKVKGGVKSLIGQHSEIIEAVKETEYENLDLIPADLSIRNMDIHLGDQRSSRKKLAESLKDLSAHYDVLFIDAPPGISLLSENLFHAADIILMPMIPTVLSIRSYDMIMEFFNENNLDKNKVFGFFSMYDSRKNMHNDIVEEYTKKKHILKTAIPYSSDVERMGIYEAPLVSYSTYSRAALAYHELWGELKKKI